MSENKRATQERIELLVSYLRSQGLETVSSVMLQLLDDRKWHPMKDFPRNGEQVLITDGDCVVMAEHPNDELIIHDITSCGFGEPIAWQRPPLAEQVIKEVTDDE